MVLGIQQISLLLIAVTLWISYKGFQDWAFKEKYVFWVDKIRYGKEHIRLLSSGFLHGGWWHLLLNMYCLYEFSRAVRLSIPLFLLLYFACLIGGNLFALYIHRNHADYKALGASGAVSGVIFASIVYNPFGGIRLFFLIPIDNWLFAILFVAISIYGIKSQRDNIGHEAHLGGAVIGMLMALAFNPSAIFVNTWVYIVTLLPVAIFLFLIIKRPELLYVPGLWKAETEKFKQNFKVKKGGQFKKSNSVKSGRFRNKEEEINYLLDKGWENLSDKEKKRFEHLSRNTDE